MQQVRDRYKRFISYISGYFYVEVPYWTFNNKQEYQKIIDSKINKIMKGGI